MQSNKSLQSIIKSMTEHALEGKDLPPLRKLFGNYILENSFVHFPSERGTGKTFFMLQVCLAVANKFNSFCEEEINIHGNTLFVNCELGNDIMSRRLTKIYENPPFPLDGPGAHEAYVFTTRRSLNEELTAVIKIINELKPVLIVIDNYKTAFQNIETNKETTRSIIEVLNLKDLYNLTLVIIDHTRKGSRLLLTESDLQSGSGTKSDLADSDMFLRKSSQDKAFRILKRVKSRNCAEEDGAKLLSFNPETLWFECIASDIDEADHINGNITNDKEEKKDLAKILREKDYTLDAIADLMNIPKTTLHRWLKD